MRIYKAKVMEVRELQNTESTRKMEGTQVKDGKNSTEAYSDREKCSKIK